MPTVMVVEDNDGVRLAMSKLLRREGYETLLARNGVEALERLRHTRPDAVLLDLHMPEMDGLTFLGIVRSDIDLRNLKVLVLTADDAPGNVEAAKRLGACGFLTKAKLTWDEVRSRIERCVDA